MNRILIVIAIIIIISGLFLIVYGVFQVDNSKIEANSQPNSEVVNNESVPPKQEEQMTKIAQVKPDTFEWCVENGGEDITQEFNTPKTCILENRIYRSSCVSNEKYFVIEKETGRDTVDVLVKEKRSPREVFSCEYVASSNDYEIKGEEPEFVYALVGNHLLFSRGTGLSRALAIYNLQQREQVFLGPFTGLAVTNDTTITFFVQSDIEASPENCPSYLENEGNYLGSAIQTRVSLDLSTLTKKELDETRCVAVQ